MSKVYSFRLNDYNPREARAREVIEAWVKQGYSLRQIIVEALLNYKQTEEKLDDSNIILDQLKDLVLSLEKQFVSDSLENNLPNSFVDSVKQAAKVGMKTNDSSFY